MAEWSIGQLAKQGGLQTSALRYYERVGLLHPSRRVGGRRRYAEDALAKLAVIQMGKQVGFTLGEIKTLVHGLEKGDRSPRALQKLARQKLPEVEAMLKHATLMRRLLRAAQSCGCPTLEACLVGARRAGILGGASKP